jgi:hypothetical protein
MVLGDSIINGGAQTDQSAIATTLLQGRLQGELSRPVIVGNVSAGSWGPPNLLAYVRRYGWFDADVVVLVFSSHDYADAPSHEPIVGVNQDFPDEKPWLATQELVTRYLPRLLGSGSSAPATQPAAEADPAHVAVCLDAVRELIRSARNAGATVLLAQHLDQREATEGPLSGHGQIARVAEEEGVPTIQLGDSFRDALQRTQAPYRDDIHPNAYGQELLAAALFDPIAAAVRGRPTTAPATTTTRPQRAH